MNSPTASSSTLTISRKTYLLSVMPVRKSCTDWPKPSMNSALARIEESPSSSITMPVSTAAATIMAGSWTGEMLAYPNSARAIAAIAAIAPDSDAVNTPVKIPRG